MLDHPSMHLCSITMSRCGSDSNAERSSSSSSSPSGPSTRTVQASRSISLRIPSRPLIWIGVALLIEYSGADLPCERLLHSGLVELQRVAQHVRNPVVGRLCLYPSPERTGADDAGGAGQERAPRTAPELVDRDRFAAAGLGPQLETRRVSSASSVSSGVAVSGVGVLGGHLVAHASTSRSIVWLDRGRRRGTIEFVG